MLDGILAGRLLGGSLACGLSLYATIAVMGLATRLGWIDTLPAGLRGLQHGFLIGTALFLLIVELVASSLRLGHSIWESIHTVIRPLGAAALVWIGLDAAPPFWRAFIALAAGGAALAAHGAKLGLRVVMSGHRRQRIAATAIEALIAAALVLAVLLHPVAAATAVIALLTVLLVIGPALLRGAAFAARAVAARLRGFFGVRRWRGPADLPSALRALLVHSAVGSPEPVAVRAALGNGQLRGAWRNGWLVIDDLGSAFLHRACTRPRRIRLEPGDVRPVRNGFLADVIDLAGDGSRFTLHLLKDGPPTEVTIGALRARRP